MEIKSLMDKKNVLPHGFPMSRDYKLPNYPCRAINCISNRSEKCISPARCIIDKDGRCKGFVKK